MATFINPRDRLLSDDLCLYKDQEHYKIDHAPLDGDINTDVCIIGGGFTGVMTALHLLQEGFKVVLIERHRIGWGASGRNSGQLIPGFNQDIRNMRKKYGPEITDAAFLATVTAMKAIKARIKKHKIDCDYAPGLSIAAVTPKGYEDMQRYSEFMTAQYNYPMATLDDDRTVDHLGSDIYHGCAVDLQAGRFNPLKYLCSIANLAVEQGLVIYEETPALRIKNLADGKAEIITPHGRIHADKTVAAGDAYQGTLLPQLRRRYLLFRTSMLATNVLSDEKLNLTLPCNHAVFEWRALTNYYTKTADGRLIFGGGDSPLVNSKKDETRAFEKIYKRMTEVYPHLKNEHITHWWGGYFGVTKDQIPEIGRTEDGIYYAYGYSGHGVVPTHMAGRVLSDMIAGKLDDHHFSAKIKAATIPGAGKHDGILAKLALLWYGMKERFD